MSNDPASVASAYFSKMRAGDESVVGLFHNDATLIGLGTTVDLFVVEEGRIRSLTYFLCAHSD